MLHHVTVYRPQRSLLAHAVQRFHTDAPLSELAKVSPELIISTMRKLQSLTGAGVGVIFTSDELRIIYSGLSILEADGWPVIAQKASDAWTGTKDDRFHPEYGYDPMRKFREMQQTLREELGAA